MSRMILLGGLNLDIAYSLTDKIAIGGRLGGLMNFYEGDFSVLIGPEVKFTFPKSNAIIAGFGSGFSVEYGILFFARTGYKFKNALFLTIESFFCDGDIGTGLGIGISFGGK